MEKVVARREVNKKTLDQYVLDEVEGVVPGAEPRVEPAADGRP